MELHLHSYIRFHDVALKHRTSVISVVNKVIPRLYYFDLFKLTHAQNSSPDKRHSVSAMFCKQNPAASERIFAEV
jgi:hypothetical protein